MRRQRASGMQSHPACRSHFADRSQVSAGDRSAAGPTAPSPSRAPSAPRAIPATVASQRRPATSRRSRKSVRSCPIRPIVPSNRETVVKALALAAALALAPAAASAGTLIAGAVRDTDGFAVAGATVVARAAGGQIVGRGTTAADGTFAIDAGPLERRRAALDVSCAFCVSQHVVLSGEPPAIVVVRYAALRDRTPSADDIAALPYDRASQVAALVPYTVVTGYGISDRGLAAGEGATAIDGIAYYRISDGRSFLNLVALLGAISFGALRAVCRVCGALRSTGTRPGALPSGDPRPSFGTRGARRRRRHRRRAAARRSGRRGIASAESFDGRNDRPSRDGTRSMQPIRRRSRSRCSRAPLRPETDPTRPGRRRAARHQGPVTRRCVRDASRPEESRSALAPAAGSFAAGSDVRADAHLRGRGPNAPWEIGVRNVSRP